MKKIEKLNKELFSEIENSQLADLSNIVGGNWVKYTLVNGQGDKEVRTGSQDGGGDDTTECSDTYKTDNTADMGYLKTEGMADQDITLFSQKATIDTPDAI